MTDQDAPFDVYFYQLVLSMQAAAWQQMGKVTSPLTGKIERNLEQAKLSIDMLEMLQRKTEGNLAEEEKTMLDRVLYELRMNYVDEANKPEPKPEADTGEGAAAENETDAGAAAGKASEGAAEGGEAQADEDTEKAGGGGS